MLTAKDVARFWAGVDRSGECWVWTKGRYTFGYGKLGIAGKVVRAHRVAWEIAFGPVPEGKHVLHRCDNPPCCRPDHLFVGTNLENIRDRQAKGRTKPALGSATGMSKLDEAKVVAMKAKYAAGNATIPQLASEYAVTASLVGQIINGRIWKHTGSGVGKGYASGERTNKNTLTAAQVREIRARYVPGLRMQSLADEYGVSLTTIYHIVKRNTWRSLD